MGGSCCACGRRRHCHSFPFIDVSLTPYVTIAKRESDGDWQRQSVRSSFFSSFWKKRGKQKFGPLLYIELRWNRICFSGFRWPPETSFLSLSLPSPKQIRFPTWFILHTFPDDDIFGGLTGSVFSRIVTFLSTFAHCSNYLIPIEKNGFGSGTMGQYCTTTLVQSTVCYWFCVGVLVRQKSRSPETGKI